MSDEQVIEEEVVAVEPEAEVVKAVEPTEAEQEARKMGWTPKDEFKGDASRWRSAEDFVERGKNMLPIVKATVKQQQKQIESLTLAMKELGEYHNKTEQLAYDRALKDLKEQRATAIAIGDGNEVNQLDDKLDELKAQQKPAPKVVKEDSNPVFEEWAKRNEWIKDDELTDYAYYIGKKLIADGDSGQGSEFYDRVKEKVKKVFPDKFENPRKKDVSSVEGSSPTARRGESKGFADMPADARAACDRMAKNAYADKPTEMAAFKAEYVKNYHSEA